MVYKKTTPNYDPIMIEEDSEHQLKEVNMQDIIYRLCYIISIKYGEREYNKFKSYVESLQAIMSPILPEDWEEELKEWNKEDQNQIKKAEERESMKMALQLKEELEIGYYYKLWKKLNLYIKKKGYSFIDAITLEA